MQTDEQGAATAVAKTEGEPKGPLIDVHKFEKIKSLGWRPERNTADNSWTAIEENGDLEGGEPRTLGPAKDMKALYTLVKIEADKNPKAALETDDNGQEPIENFQKPAGEQRLPGLEEPEIEDLNRLADVCIEKLEKRKQATTASKDADDIMRVAMHKFNRKRYNRKGWSIVIEDSEKLIVKKAENAPPKNPKQGKNG